VEEVVRVICGLDLAKPLVVAALSGANPVRSLFHHEVDVRSPGRIRVQRIPIVAAHFFIHSLLAGSGSTPEMIMDQVASLYPHAVSSLPLRFYFSVVQQEQAHA
jgi:hypothetical protein